MAITGPGCPPTLAGTHCQTWQALSPPAPPPCAPLRWPPWQAPAAPAAAGRTSCLASTRWGAVVVPHTGSVVHVMCFSSAGEALPCLAMSPARPMPPCTCKLATAGVGDAAGLPLCICGGGDQPGIQVFRCRCQGELLLRRRNERESMGCWWMRRRVHTCKACLSACGSATGSATALAAAVSSSAPTPNNFVNGPAPAPGGHPHRHHPAVARAGLFPRGAHLCGQAWRYRRGRWPAPGGPARR